MVVMRYFMVTGSTMNSLVNYSKMGKRRKHNIYLLSANQLKFKFRKEVSLNLVFNMRLNKR